MPVIRTTYALDAATVEELGEPRAGQRQEAWGRLRGSLAPAEAEAWRRRLRQERAASDPRRRKP